MIITKSPFRITLGGGGASDFQSYFCKFGPTVSTGFAFNKYCYLTLMHLPNINDTNFQIGYSKFERVQQVNNIENNGIRGVLEVISKKNNINFEKLGINIVNQISSRTGIGSSSALCCSLIYALYSYLQKEISKKELAKLSIQVERDHLKEVGGLNDQIFSSFGDFISINYDTDGSFLVKPLSISSEFKKYLVSSSVLYYTSEYNSRNSFQIAESYENKDSLSYKHQISELSFKIKEQLENENLINVGLLIKQTWEAKKKISKLISNHSIDKIYDIIMSSGAIGCRLMGSGGSGFFFTIYSSPESKYKALQELQIPYIDIDIDYDGTKTIFKE